MVFFKNSLKFSHNHMTKRIKKVAVLGSGVMGSGIACHLANVGLEVLMLDIVPFDLDEKQEILAFLNQLRR